MWNEVHKTAFNSVKVALNANNIEWLVMRNYEGLPEHNRSKDLDIGVSHKEFKRASNIISNVLERIGFDNKNIIRYQYAICATYYYVSNDSLESIKIDLIDGFVWRGAQIVDFEDIYCRKKKYKDFFVPCIADDAFMLLIKPLMTGGFVKKKYVPDIDKGIDTYQEDLKRLYENTFGEKLFYQSWPWIVNHTYENLIPLKSRLCRSAWKRSFFKHPIQTIKNTVEHFYLEIKRCFIRKKPTMFAVLGPDGVGKSTFIDRFIAELADISVCDIKDIKVYHFRPNIFPNIKKLLGGKSYDESKEEFTNPHRGGKTNPVSSFIRMVYYWLDYNIGYYAKIKLQCRHNGKVVFDRYISDYLVDPERSRVYLPYAIRKIFVKLTPQPDLSFVLMCDPQIIISRKKELEIHEIKDIISGYEKVARNNKKYVILDASKSPQLIVKDALSEYMKRCN